MILVVMFVMRIVMVYIYDDLESKNNDLSQIWREPAKGNINLI